jgi:fatty acid desaturase
MQLTGPAKDPYSPFRKDLLPAARVRELSRLEPWRPVRDTALCWAWIVAAWTAVAVHPAWWTVLLALPVIGNRFYALLIIGHDGLHGRLFPNRVLQDIFCDLFHFGPIGAIRRLNNQNHLAHHAFLGSERDPDHHKYTAENKARRVDLAGYVLGVRSVVQSVRNVFFPAPAGSQKGTSKTGPRYSARDLLILAGWQLALLVGLTLTIGWWAYLVLWWLPVYTFAFLGDNLRTFAEHSQPGPDAEADGHRLITFLSNPVERMLVSPMNMNYHVVHHLWPSIPYYNLPRANCEVRELAGADPRLEWRGSYFVYLLRFFRALPFRWRRTETTAKDSRNRAA